MNDDLTGSKPSIRNCYRKKQSEENNVEILNIYMKYSQAESYELWKS